MTHSSVEHVVANAAGLITATAAAGCLARLVICPWLLVAAVSRLVTVCYGKCYVTMKITLDVR